MYRFNNLVKSNNKFSNISSKIKNRHIGLINDERIIYCEASGSYTWVVLSSGTKIKLSFRLGKVEKLISSPLLIRCHKSFTINIKYVEDVSEKKPYLLVLSNGDVIPIAVSKRNQILRQLFNIV